MNRLVLLLCPSICLLLACCQPNPTRPFEALAGEEYFMRHVKPILETRCVICHREARPPAGLTLVQRSGLYAPKRNGRAFVVPGDPSASLLLTSVADGGRHPRVANVDPLLTGNQVDILYEWIEDGAYWPDNPKGFLQPKAAVVRRSTTTVEQSQISFK